MLYYMQSSFVFFHPSSYQYYGVILIYSIKILAIGHCFPPFYIFLGQHRFPIFSCIIHITFFNHCAIYLPYDIAAIPINFCDSRLNNLRISILFYDYTGLYFFFRTLFSNVLNFLYVGENCTMVIKYIYIYINIRVCVYVAFKISQYMHVYYFCIWENVFFILNAINPIDVYGLGTFFISKMLLL